MDSAERERMLTTEMIPFELPAPRVRATVKVINQTSMENVTVIDDPKAPPSVLRRPKG